MFARSGSGPPLLLLHGLGHRWQAWEPVIDRLEAHHDVIAVDLPGFARSPLPAGGILTAMPLLLTAVSEFLASEGIEGPHAAGNSLGGAIALELAAAGRATSVTALAPAGFATRPQRRRARLPCRTLHPWPWIRCPVAGDLRDWLRSPRHASVEEAPMRATSFLTVPAIVLVALTLTLTTPGTVEGQVDTAVSIAGTLTGPSGVAKLGVSVRGTPQHLTGGGGSADVALASPATFTFDGALDGSVVTLQGHVAHAAFEFLVGTPVTLTADTSTNETELSFGPVPDGPLAGQTLTFSGIGDVSLADPRDRGSRRS